MKITRPAVVLLLVIWAAVLVVPSLNFLLRLQLRSTEGVALSVWPVELELSPPWEKIAKRFPDNKSVLYMAAIAPPPEKLLLEQLRAEAGSKEKDLPEPAPPRVEPDSSPSDDSETEPLLTDRETDKISDLKWRENARRVELLRQRYPGDAFLVAAQLQVMRKGLLIERVGGELSDARSPEERRGQVSPERLKEKTNFSPADFGKALELCALGQRLAPDNGYFDWLKCYFLLYSWRDAQAFKALEAVARKKEFNDYTTRERELNLEAQSLALGRRLLHEEKVLTTAFIGTFNGAYQRGMARILSWESIKARRRGDHAQAMQMMATQARAYRKMREKSHDLIQALVYSAMESMAWHATTNNVQEPDGTKEQGDAWRRKNLQEYVTLHGRPELAREAARDEAARKRFSVLALSLVKEGKISGIAQSTYALSAWLWALSVVLLILLALPVLGALLLFVLKHSRQIKTWCRWEESQANEAPSARAVWRGMFAVTGLPALTLAFFGLAAGVSLAILWEFGPSRFNEQWLQLLAAKGLHLLDDEGRFSISVSDWWNWGLQLPIFETPWRVVLLWTPVVFGMLFAAGRATDWQQGENGTVKRSLTARVAGLALGMGVSLCWFTLTLDIWPEEQAWWRGVALVGALLCATLILYDKYLLWRGLPHKRAAVRYGLRLLQRSLFTWLVVGSALYFAALVLSVPVRQQADAGFEQFLTEGDIPATMTANEP